MEARGIRAGTTNMNLCIDLDGCLFDYNYPYAKLLIKVSGEDKFPAGWQDDQSILAPVWDWDTLHGYDKETQAEVWQNHILPAKKNFWLKLPLLAGAKETILHLDSLVRHGHNVYFLTHRMGENAKYQTEKALYNAGIAFPTVLLCHAEDKHLIAAGLYCDIFIEDKIDTANAAVDFGLAGVYLIDAPYNGGEFAGTRVSSVKEALELNDLWKTPSNS